MKKYSLLLMLGLGLNFLSFASDEGAKKNGVSSMHPSLAKYVMESILPNNKVARAAIQVMWKYKKPLAATAGWNIMLSTGLYGVSWVPFSETAFNAIKSRIPGLNKFSNKQIRIFIRVLPLIIYIIIEAKNKIQSVIAVKPVLPDGFSPQNTTHNITNTITTSNAQGDLVQGGKKEMTVNGDNIVGSQHKSYQVIYAPLAHLNPATLQLMIDNVNSPVVERLLVAITTMPSESKISDARKSFTFGASSEEMKSEVLAISLSEESNNESIIEEGRENLTLSVGEVAQQPNPADKRSLLTQTISFFINIFNTETKENQEDDDSSSDDE